MNLALDHEEILHIITVTFIINGFKIFTSNLYWDVSKQIPLNRNYWHTFLSFLFMAYYRLIQPIIMCKTILKRVGVVER